MRSFLSMATVAMIGLGSTFVPEARAQGPVPPAPSAPGHLERPDQAPIRFIGPRQVSPPPSCEFLTVNGLTSVQINVDEDGNNIIDDAANETTIAINPLDPDNIVIGWRQFDTIRSNFRQSGVASSHDGGMTWTNRGPLQADTFGSDPVLGVDAEGVFYYAAISSRQGEVRLFRSFNDGVDWDPAIQVIATAFDKEWFTIDRTGGIGRGHLYMTWTDSRNFTRSTDSGENWMTPIDTPLTNGVWGTLSVGPDGELYIVDRLFRVARSDDAQDAGRRPTFPQFIDVDLGGNVVAFAPPNPDGLLGQPWIETDHSDAETRGNVYLLCGVRPESNDPMNVMFARSTDGGLTWTDPIRVNDDPEDPDAWQWFEAMDVAPSGRIDAVWYDTRNTLDAVFSEVFYAYSTDAGDTWSSNMQVAPVFNSTIGWPQQDKIGDYIGVISDAAAANVAYAATYNGEQDVYFLSIEIDCNENGVHDGDDIITGLSGDCNANAVPDECEEDEDCNDNGIRDLCEPADEDCNENDVPDECDIRDGTSEDCNENGVPDECEYALSFERSSARVIFSDFDGFPTGEITVSLWLRTSDTSREAGIFSYAVSAEDDEFLILDARNLSLFINGGAVQSGIAVTDGDSHHIALTWASVDGVGRLYVDGIERFSGVVAPGHLLRPEGTVVLAQDQDSVGGGFDSRQSLRGAIDELRVWNIVRSEEEIRADMRRTLNADERGLVSYWRFEEGEGVTTEDLTGDNDGEVLQAVWIETFYYLCECVRDPEWLCDGDVDGDEQVNPVDSGLVQAAFGSVDDQDLCNYDLDCDGQINPVDSGIVQSLFGTCEAPRDVCP